MNEVTKDYLGSLVFKVLMAYLVAPVLQAQLDPLVLLVHPEYPDNQKNLTNQVLPDPLDRKVFFLF